MNAAQIGASAVVTAAIVTVTGTVVAVLLTILGTVIAPMLRDHFAAKASRKRERQEKIGEALLDFQVALGEAVTGSEALKLAPHLKDLPGVNIDLAAAVGFNTMRPLIRLELLLTQEERPLVDIALATDQAVQTRIVPEVGHIWGSFITVSSAWFREALKTSEIEATFESMTQPHFESLKRKQAESDSTDQPTDASDGTAHPDNASGTA